MGRMFLGRVRASGGHAPLSDGGVSASDCRDRMFEIDTRAENCGTRPSAGRQRGVEGRMCSAQGQPPHVLGRIAQCSRGH